MALTAQEAAEKFGSVRKDNYLAHTIKDIERYVLTHEGKCYPILIYPSEVRHFKCDFHKKYCAIRMPRDCDGIDVGEIRLRLAHELGHIITNMDKLGDLGRLNAPRTEEEIGNEEIEAWTFAFLLLRKKSQEHQSRIYDPFIHKDTALIDIIVDLVKSFKPAVSKTLERRLRSL